ncbi:uncharacterized protein FisN_2Hh185 [Fistulifera solaris]|uniref:GPN-loop GTPase 3 n=1 Tax=Fistulifera solaris TaxID=1519565 RepID=A0A1Z5KJV1_FISSO|nr:uncharacterized protein FisN_2Hh185 [Fistulifera solaris]|eukprot:GAX26395.1 uncharacterized protein FisN_2Hh185 [Fistulifera solaris]
MSRRIGCIQIVMGPAGSGKTTYCQAMQQHMPSARIANLDPAAEDDSLPYEPSMDVRELISVPEVMEELQLGPNGALLYCMEYLLEHLEDWFRDELDALEDEEGYLILDCPGQIELYTHVPIMRQILDRMQQWGYGPSMVAVFCIDSAFCIDASKFLSGTLLSLSAMVALELPHVTILTKCDLMDEREVERILEYGSAQAIWDREQDRQTLLRRTNWNNYDLDVVEPEPNPTTISPEEKERIQLLEDRRLRRERLTQSISQVLDDWQMVSFVPLNIRDEESLDHVFSLVNHAVQYGEDLEVKEPPHDFDDDDGPM